MANDFTSPLASFHDDHLKANGTAAPNCLIKLRLLCLDGDCPDGDMTVHVIEMDSNAVLAEGDVRCRGDWTLHSLPMRERRSLAATRVRVRFRCGGASEDDPETRIWCKCEE